MNIKLLGIVAILSGLTVVACGDDEGSGGSGTTTSSTTGSTGSSSTKSTTTGGTTTGSTTSTGGMACALPDTTAPADCAEACSDLYDCGALTCMGDTLCAFDGSAAEKDLWTNGTDMNGCLATCAANMALVAIIDPGDCAQTVTTLKTLNATFADSCDNGIGAGGGAGN
ncbi:MAG: hypothetical protein JNL21_38795 [Myxococcales bacterium]|nr:hypothetical protein [Myxococcales bacterium]